MFNATSIDPARLAKRALPFACLFGPIALYALLTYTTSNAYSLWQNTLLYNVPFVAAVVCALQHARTSQDKLAWRMIALGLACYAAGHSLHDFERHYSSPLAWWAPDALSLMMPVCLYGAITLLVRARVNVWQPSTALDGLIIALGGSTLLYQTIYAPLLTDEKGYTAQSIVYAAYPIADLMLLAIAASSAVLLKHSFRSGWGALHMAFIAFTVADTAFLYDAADGAYSSGGSRDLIWMAAGALIGLAALCRWRNTGVENIDASSVIFWPVSMSFIMIAYLAGGMIHDSLQTGASMLGLACLALTVARVAFTIWEGHKLFSTRRESRTDEVTGLGNRRNFDEHLARAVAAKQPFAVVMMDLDGFKQINDGFGHDIGDMVLIEVAKRIERTTPEDTFSARIGGDEFGLIIKGADEKRLREVTDELLASIQSSYLFEVNMGEEGEILSDEDAKAATGEVQTSAINAIIGASIGCSLYPRDGDELSLTRFADSAMYQIKKSGGGVLVHEPVGDMCEDIQANQFQMLKDLRQALHKDSEENRLTVHYQPIVPLRKGDGLVMEALVRWQRHGELVSPGSFISLAETGGLMQMMTTKVLDQALREVAIWRKGGVDVAVSVNLAVSSLLDPTLMKTLKQALAEHGVAPSALKLEITESMIIMDPHIAQRTVASLRELGIGVMIDDYGTGYSSFAHLQQLDISGLKIDQSFIADMMESPRVKLLVQSVIDMARAMELGIVAEGVETQEQQETLKAMGCDQLQGYHISRPMPADQVAQWIDTYPVLSLVKVA